MNHKISFFRILLAVIVINSAGFLLRYFELDTYFILLGFRFHLSFTLPLLFIFRPDLLTGIKKIFTQLSYKKNFLFLLLIFLPLFILAGLLYFFYDIKIGDPEYFYELGLSSIVDYPIYLLWNFPQAAFLLLFLILSSEIFKLKFLYLFLIIPLLFAYEFIPINGEEINYINIGVFLITSFSLILLIKYFQNIYWIYITFFSLFWSNILAFGTDSAILTRNLLANQYSEWEGFFIVPKVISEYLLASHVLAFLVLLVISSLLKKW